MKTHCLSFFLIVTTFAPFVCYADFLLTHGSREFIGAPIGFGGNYLFVTCLGVPIQIPDDATVTFNSKMSCNYETHTVGESTAMTGIGNHWPIPAPVVNSPPCEKDGDVIPTLHLKSDKMLDLFRPINRTIKELGISSLGADMMDGISEQDIVLKWVPPDSSDKIIGEIPLFIETDISRAIISVRDKMSDDCEDPDPVPPVSCPNCIEALRSYVEGNKNWRELWWNNDSEIVQNYYTSMSTAANVNPKIGQIIADDLLLKYQFTSDFFNGQIIEFHANQ